MKLSEECNSLQANVNQLKCKLESCEKKLVATERELEEKECQAIENYNALQVILSLCAAVIFIRSTSES